LSATDATTIWTDYRQSLSAYLRSRVTNPADAEDLLQDILLKTHQALPSLDAGTALRPWLFRIARNALTDHYRKTGRRQEVLLPEDLAAEVEERDPLEGLENCLTPFLDGLPDESRSLLTAIEVGGRSQRDIAEDKGLAYSTLKSRVQKARDDMRGLFDKCCKFSLSADGRVVDYSSRSASCKNC